MPAADGRRFVLNCKRWELVVPYMYLDEKGLVTVGIGNLLRTEAAALALPFQNRAAGRMATPGEIRARYLAVKAMKPAMKWTAYRLTSPEIELDPEEIDKLLLARLDGEFLPGLRRRYPGFDAFPFPAQEGCVDMVFTMGFGIEAGPPKERKGMAGFPTFNSALRAKPPDFILASNECHRADARPERNAWTKGKFLEASTTLV